MADIPMLTVILEDDGRIIERRGCAGSPDPHGGRAAYVEAVMSSGDPSKEGLYADVWYHTPADRCDDPAEGASLLAVEPAWRLWYFSPEEAPRVIAVLEGRDPLLARVDGELVDCRRLRLLAMRYTGAMDAGGLVATVAGLYDAMRREALLSLPVGAGEAPGVDEEIARQMGLPLSTVLSWVSLDAAISGEGVGASGEDWLEAAAIDASCSGPSEFDI